MISLDKITSGTHVEIKINFPLNSIVYKVAGTLADMLSQRQVSREGNARECRDKLLSLLSLRKCQLALPPFSFSKLESSNLGHSRVCGSQSCQL